MSSLNKQEEGDYMNAIIQTLNLSKKYKEVNAVSDLNLSINKGEIYGFIGLNGAGKTTTIKMLLGMITPTAGTIYLYSQKINQRNLDIWKDVGYIVETPYSYPELTVEENLEIIYKLRDIQDKNAVAWIINKLKLEKYKNVKAKNLSLGNSQRLGIAKSLIHRPKILMLDEPTNGLDPAGIVEVRQLLLDLAKNDDVTILISSHKLDEISKIVTRIGIIHDGKLIKEIATQQLEKELKKSLILNGKNQKKIKEILSKLGYQVDLKRKDNQSYLEISDEEIVKSPEKIVEILVYENQPPNLLRIEKEDLEMYFLRIIQESRGD